MTEQPAFDEQSAAADRHHRAYTQAMASVQHGIAQFGGCSKAEKEKLGRELAELEAISRKLEMGHVEIVIFGEIDTGKSALINALVGKAVAEVDVRGGWTKDVWRVVGGQRLCRARFRRVGGRPHRHARYQ